MREKKKKNEEEEINVMLRGDKNRVLSSRAHVLQSLFSSLQFLSLT